MSQVCQATAAICKRLQFWLEETVCRDLQYPKRNGPAYNQRNETHLPTVSAYEQWSASRAFGVVA